MDIIRKFHKQAEDIDGAILQIGDVVVITQERMDKYHSYGAKVGEQLRIKEIYTMPDLYGDDLLGKLDYTDGSGRIWNSLLNLYRKVDG